MELSLKESKEIATVLWILIDFDSESDVKLNDDISQVKTRNILFCTTMQIYKSEITTSDGLEKSYFLKIYFPRYVLTFNVKF